MHCTFTQSMFSALPAWLEASASKAAFVRARHLVLLHLIEHLRASTQAHILWPSSHQGAPDTKRHLDLRFEESPNDRWRLTSEWRKGGSLITLDKYETLISLYHQRSQFDHSFPLIIAFDVSNPDELREVINDHLDKGRSAKLLKHASILLTACVATSPPCHDHVEWLCSDKQALTRVLECDEKTCAKIAALSAESPDELPEWLRGLL